MSLAGTRRTRGRRTTARSTRGVNRRSTSRRGQPRRRLSRASDDSVELMENDEPEVITLGEGPGDESGVCIDLTEDTDDSIVDLTNVETPITLRRELPERRQMTLRSPGRDRNVRDQDLISDDEDDDLPDLPPFVCESTSPRRPRETGSAGSSAMSVTSPPAKFTCPVCLEDDKQIRRAGKKLYSTICGHLFCQECIQGVLQNQRKCPSCRKNLTARQVHPIYL